VIGVVILSALGVRTFLRTGDWENGQVLYERAVKVVPNSARVQCNLGFQRMKRKQAAEAEPFLRRALEIYPDYLKAHSQLALCRLAQGDRDAALLHFHRAAAHARATRDDLHNYLEAVRRFPGGAAHKAIARELIQIRLEEDPDDPELQRLRQEFR
jgi:tetratricopeptide (TPR) repeat protein